LSERQVAISFMTLAELLVWPRANNWGAARKTALEERVGSYTLLMPDKDTCRLWADIRTECQAAGSPIAPNDAWIAATAKRWDLQLVTGNFRDYVAVSGLKLVPIE
jgi:tRNA(fMet)-specific endonuclease VapC